MFEIFLFLLRIPRGGVVSIFDDLWRGEIDIKRHVLSIFYILFSLKIIYFIHNTIMCFPGLIFIFFKFFFKDISLILKIHFQFARGK